MLLRITESSGFPGSALLKLRLGDTVHQEVSAPLAQAAAAVAASPLRAGGDVVRQLLTRRDLGELQVEIAAEQPGFLALDWESLTLPGQDKPLSLQCAGFFRSSGAAAVPARPDGSADLVGRSALQVLYVVASGAADAPVHSDVYSVLARSLECERPVRFELLVDPDEATLERALARRDRTIDVVHIEGGCTRRDAAWMLFVHRGTGNDAYVDLAALLSRVRDAGVRLALLGLEPDAADSASAALMLGELAAAVPGLTLLGYHAAAAAQLRSAHAMAIYRRLAAGVPVARAVVEARIEHGAPAAAPALVQYGDAVTAFFPPSEASDVDKVLAQPYSRIRRRMFGFRAAMLPPECKSSSSGGFLALVRNQVAASACAIEGDAGSGRTHLAHQLAFYRCLQDETALAFYFDYGEAFYSRSDIVDMLAPVLGVDTREQEAVEAALGRQACHFVIDTFPVAGAVTGVAADTCAEAAEFLRVLAGRHQVTFVGDAVVGAVDSAFRPPALGVEELMVIADECITALGLERKGIGFDRLRIAAMARNNPWLLKKSLARLLTQGEDLLYGELETMAEGGPGDCISRYYDVQFSGLAGHWQTLLWLMLDYPGVYFQMLCVAPELPDSASPSPARILLSELGAADAALSELLPILESTGFLARSGLGHLLDPAARRYLLRLREVRALPAPDPRLTLALSRLLCESLCIVAPRLQGGENQILAAPIVGNRHHWARCLEALWRAREFSAFFQARHHLQQLLALHRLGDEIDEWSHDLLCRTDSDYYESAADMGSVLAWLSLARSSLTSRDRAGHPLLTVATESLFQRFSAARMESRPDQDELAFFSLCTHFLEGSFSLTGQWERCYAVSARAREIGQRLGQANRVIRSLKSMARCCLALGRLEEGVGLEEELLDQVYRDDLPIPPQTRMMLGLECLDDRIRRGDAGAAQRVLDRIVAGRAEKPLQCLLDRYQADILFLQGRLEESATRYARLRRSCTPKELSAIGAAHVDARLSTLEQKLGSVTFERLCGTLADPQSVAQH